MNEGWQERPSKSVTSRCYVIEVGRVVLEGDTREIMTNETLVRKAFLGK
jgi:ABC-type lipopolysaccharide export system ATPase subunit